MLRLGLCLSLLALCLNFLCNSGQYPLETAEQRVIGGITQGQQ
jgi:hypothetical protein